MAIEPPTWFAVGVPLISVKWYYGDPGKSYQAYLCINSDREPKRTKADQERLETVRHILLTHPDLDNGEYCESTGGRMKHHLATEMLLCALDQLTRGN